MKDRVRWGILGAANIAHHSFIPAVRQTREGQIIAVASRDFERATRFAQAEEIEVGLRGYDQVLQRNDIDAVYVALPNHLHAHWTIEAMKAGKHVLCEKPLGMNSAEVSQVLNAAKNSGTFLWEAFAFPFRREHQLLCRWIESGQIGAIRHIQSSFFSTISDPGDIRWNKAFGGGALLDVGCYPIHLAHEWFAHPQSMQSMMMFKGTVDIEVQAQVAYGDEGQVLQFLAGLNRPYETASRILGTTGRIEVSNPFHPTNADTIRMVNNTGEELFSVTSDEVSFEPMLRHIQKAMMGSEGPHHQAGERTLRTAMVMEQLRDAAVIIAKED